MNDRIQELIPRPWTFPYPDREMYSKEQMEHFAELIIRKCMLLSIYQSDASYVSNYIAEYFGVE